MATKTTRNKQLERCVQAAMKAGAPRDQIENLVQNAGYIPYPWQWEFHAAAREADYPDGPTDIDCGGARGPGKSHAILSQTGLDDCQRYEGLKGLFLRQTGVSAQESFDDLIHKTLRGRCDYRKTKNSIRFTNGSRIILGGFKDESDIDKYIGIEYDFIIIEELTQLTKEKYDKLKGSLRTSKEGWRPRIYSSCNPGGVGHAWVREMFVLPYRQNKSKEKSYLYIEPTTGNAIRVCFIPSTYKENPALNPEYITYLESIGGDLGKAWREGEWDLFAGQYFSEWRYEKHVVRPFTVPLTWKRFRSIDPSGRDGITSCHWYALDSDGRVWCYREYYYGVGVEAIGPDGRKHRIQVGRDYDQHAIEIAKLSASEDGVPEDYLYTIIDTAAFSKAGFSETAAEIFERHGVTGLLPAAKERVVGWNAVHYYLRHDDIHRQPLLQIFETCANIIRTIPLLQHDEKRPEDVDSRGEDHCLAGDTLVETTQGQKAIKDMVGTTGLVYTTAGPMPYHSVRMTNNTAEVMEITTADGREIVATLDHPFLTISGWKLAEQLTMADGLIQLDTCDRSLSQEPVRNSMGSAITSVGFITRTLNTAVSIGKYTRRMWEQFQRNTISTIRITIEVITTPATLRVSRSSSTYPCMQGLLNLALDQRYLSSNTPYLPPELGTKAQRVENGTKSISKKHGSIGSGQSDTAISAANSIKPPSLHVPNSVIKIAKLQHVGVASVYNMEVPHVRNFVVNGGIVVHNCADELRYVLRTFREAKAPRPLTKVERRIKDLQALEHQGDFQYSRQ